MEFPTHDFLNGEVTVIDLPERLTSDTSDNLKILIKDLVADKKHKLVMNLEETKYMDSSGLGALVSKIAATRSQRGDIRLANPQKYIVELLELTHINQIIKSFDTIEMAVNSFRE